MTRIETLLDRLGIAFKRTGRELRARCPNPEHMDRNPSWSVRDDDSDKSGQHFCFACGWGGGLLKLVTTVAKCDDDTARNILGEKESVVRTEVEVEFLNNDSFRMPIGVKLGEPEEKWPSLAYKYLHSRGVADWQVERWSLGFSVIGRLAGRIVIPYFTKARRLTGYSARTFVNDSKRYLEATATKRCLFGELHWPDQPRNHPIIVTEAALDALVAERIIYNRLGGSTFPVAGLGGAMLTPRISGIAQFGLVIIATDSDAAGDILATRLTEILSRHTTVKRARLQTGKDVCAAKPEEVEEKIFNLWFDWKDEEMSGSANRTPSSGK